MKKTGKYLLSAAFMLVGLLSIIGQDVTFNASVDKNPIYTGDVFSLRLTLENGRGDIEAPDLSDFQVVFGPSQSSSYRIVNGRQSSSISLSYTMRPRGVGKFTIAPAVARVDGRSYRTEPIVVDVLKGSGSSQNAQPQSGNAGSGNQAEATQDNENVKVQIQVSKSNVYQGEQVVLTYVLYSRYNAIDLRESDFPKLSGFWAEEVKSDQASWEDALETINGVPYRKAILKMQVLFPQRSGTLEIEPLRLTCRVNRTFFNPGTEIRAASNTVRINVKPLPANAPETFMGAVGNLDLSVKTVEDNIQANEAIDLSLTISGRGNLTLLQAPSVAFPADFDAYDPEVKSKISVTAGGVTGSRTYQYLVIPRYPGKYEIPEITFTYFDPIGEKYVTKTKGPFAFEVKGDNGLVPDGNGERRAQNKVEQARNDIRYIMTDSRNFVSHGKRFFGTLAYYAILLAPFLLFFGFIVFSKRRRALESDVSGSRRRHANKMARRRLAAAEKAMNASDSTKFYAEIFSATYGYLGDKLGVSPGALSRPVLRQRLLDAGVEEEVVYDALRIVETCEMARFAPVTEQSDFSFYKRVVELIEKLENTLK